MLYKVLFIKKKHNISYKYIIYKIIFNNINIII